MSGGVVGAFKPTVDELATLVFVAGSSGVRESEDPLGKIVNWVDTHTIPEGKTLAFIGSAESLYKGIGHLSILSKVPVVFHVEVSQDYGSVAALRHAGLAFLQSFGPEDAQDIAVTAHLLAGQLSKPVVHFYSSVDGGAREAPRRWTSERLEALFKPAVPEESAESVETENTTEEAVDAVKVPLEDSVASALAAAAPDYSAFEWRGDNKAKTALVVLGDSENIAEAIAKTAGTGLLVPRVYAPFDADALLKTLPSSVSQVAVLEQVLRPTSSLLPLTSDIFGASPEALTGAGLSKLHSYQLGCVESAVAAKTLIEKIVADFSASVAPGTLIGGEFPAHKAGSNHFVASAQKLEDVYFKVLQQLVPNLSLLNGPGADNNTPEFAFGKFLAAQQKARDVIDCVRDGVKQGKFGQASSSWVVDPRNPVLLQEASKETQADLSSAGAQNWIIGSDAWAYDLGNSGVHHVLASKSNVKMLIIDSSPRDSPKPGKKDIALYAMGFGDVYVASVAVYASYTQLLEAILEAEAYDGPAVVVAYLPYSDPSKDDALEVLRETKKAVETGYWPLYRYNPAAKNDDDVMTLDSFTIRKSLQDFLARENKLTLLSRKIPAFARSLTSSLGSETAAAQKKKAQDAYAALLEGLSGPPLLVLFASDGGQAESVARRLTRRAAARGLKASVKAFDDLADDVEQLSREENVVFITSTAGQGEFPQNGRALWGIIKDEQLELNNTKVAVFGMGDSQYWPRKQDKHYYNKPAHDLSARLKLLGAAELAELALGDDQDADGWSTGYNEWEPLIWKALGVDGVSGGDEPPPITNEDIKLGSNYLRGTIAEGLQDKSTGAISASDQQLTKFHGIYMQDDRDVRDERKTAGLEPAYSFMVRVRLPGCIATPLQWLMIDELASSRGNETFKITTRGTFQLHGVIKEDLKPAVRGMNSVLLDTVAACGDVDRNVVASAMPYNAKIHRRVADISKNLSEHLLPRTTAYYEIWLEGSDEGDKPGFAEAWENRTDGGPTKKPKKSLVAQSPIEDFEPLYGDVYLPRKFKINVAVPPYNDVDVYGHDIGLITIVNEANDDVIGFNVLVGGGMGTTHNNKKTYPRTGSLIGFAPVSKILDVCEKVMLVQRDFGDRKNRKHARLKYTVDDLGVDVFKGKVEEYLGYSLEPAKEHPAFKTNVDSYGWIRDEEGRNHFTTFVENGRVEDTPELQHRSGFREIAKLMQKKGEGEFRLTANQHILVADISDNLKPEIDTLLQKYKLDNLSFSGLRLSSAACVAFPTCGLAMAESERYLPELVTKLEGALEDYGLRHDSIVMRMTGCPNGCARPWLAEVALVGKAYGAYNLMLGGGHVGQRLNKLYRSSLKEDEILSTLKPMFKSWALERNDGEPFGDFVIRKGIISATRQGLDWWDNVEPGLE